MQDLAYRRLHRIIGYWMGGCCGLDEAESEQEIYKLIKPCGLRLRAHNIHTGHFCGNKKTISVR